MNDTTAIQNAAKAEAFREAAAEIEQGWRLDRDRLWKPAENHAWVNYFRAKADALEAKR